VIKRQPSPFKIVPTKKGIAVQKYDTRHDKWNNCGQIITIRGEKGYFSTHRTILYKHNSLGISEDILKFLADEEVIVIIKRVGTKKRGYNYYGSTIKYYTDNGMEVEVGNENQNMIHIPLREHTYIGKKLKETKPGGEKL